MRTSPVFRSSVAADPGERLSSTALEEHLARPWRRVGRPVRRPRLGPSLPGRAGVALVAVLLAGCSSSDDAAAPEASAAVQAPTGGTPGDAVGPAPAGAPVPSGSSGASAAAPSAGSGETVTLAFAGDTHFERGLDDGRLGGLGKVLAAADLAVVNLETAVTERGDPVPKQFVFRGPASALDGVVESGVDAVNLANNHGMDYGRTGLLDTLDAGERAGLPVIGAGRDAAQAYAPLRRTIKGQRIAVIGATQVLDSSVKAAWTAQEGKPGLASAYEVETLLASVREARATSDTVVVFLHWGVERQTCPPPQAVTLTGQLVEAGADVIVGSHAHVLLGDGRRGNAYVHYGLGNFLWYNGVGAGAQTGVLTLSVRGRTTTEARWDPGRVTGGRPEPLSGAPREKALREREQRRACTGLSAP